MTRPVETLKPLYLTRNEVATLLNVSTRTLDRWVEQGRIKSYRVNGIQSLRFKVSDVDKLLIPVEKEGSPPGTEK